MSYSKGNRGLGKGLTDMPSFQNHSLKGAGIKDNSLFRKTAEKPSDPSLANSPKIVAQMAGDIAMIPIGQIEPNNDLLKFGIMPFYQMELIYIRILPFEVF